MSRPLAGALFAVALAGFGGSELLAIRNKPQQTECGEQICGRGNPGP